MIVPQSAHQICTLHAMRTEIYNISYDALGPEHFKTISARLDAVESRIKIFDRDMSRHEAHKTYLQLLGFVSDKEKLRSLSVTEQKILQQMRLRAELFLAVTELLWGSNVRFDYIMSQFSYLESACIEIDKRSPRKSIVEELLISLHKSAQLTGH